jgi:glucuronate isomerase
MIFWSTILTLTELNGSDLTMSFINEDFLLRSQPARELYHNFAKDAPIYDYHCHLPPDEVAADRRFKDLYEIWLAGDHYKWRAMRTNGIAERFCTGDADPYEKFLAFCETVPHTVRNPLYHWCHLELLRYFDIKEQINPANARRIWDQASERLSAPEFSARGILNRFKVAVVGTTDDPTDDLVHHAKVVSANISTRMVPTFRPDKGLRVDMPAAFNDWVDKLSQIAQVECKDLAGYLKALEVRHEAFHAMGARLSDHGMERAMHMETSFAAVARIFQNARAGQVLSADDCEAFAFYVLRHIGQLNHQKGWTMQFHLGVMRNNNSRALRNCGTDSGFDSIHDVPQAIKLSRFLDSLDSDGCLPKVILYNLNPADNYLMATMAGNFQDGSIPGKVQFGSGWWFNDQKEAMIWQMNALSNLGLLSRFVGMLTDSRSFLSYCRHEYFRRILCDLIGTDVVNGELPADYELLGDLVQRIAFRNARDYFGIALAPAYAEW